MIIRPSSYKCRGRYEEVEFDVPGVVRTKRCRVDVTLDFVTKEVADAYGPKLREAKRITDTLHFDSLSSQPRRLREVLVALRLLQTGLSNYTGVSTAR
jgi:hypothetical protein